MRKTFRGAIVRDGSLCFILVPFDPRPVFGKVRAPVRVTLNGYTYRSTIASMGSGPCVPLRRSHREAAGLDGSESLEVTLELDADERLIEPPEDFARALKAKKLAWGRWRELSYSHQREHVEAIEEAKKPETRARRIQSAVEAIAASPSKSRAQRQVEPHDRAAGGAAPGARKELRGRADDGEAASASTMTRYALLLRGVNVGTKNSLPMAQLRAMLTKLGCTDVQTYVQSGNAVLDTKLAEAAITKAIEDALEAYMGRPIPTTLRTLDEMKAIVVANPFANVATKPANLCVTFLASAPTKAEVAPLQAQEWKPELFKVVGREIFTWHPNGQGRSPLAAALGRLPLRGATTRNWNTVLKLLEMLDR